MSRPRHYCGRSFSASELALIRELIADHPGLNRAQLSRLVCERLVDSFDAYLAQEAAALQGLVHGDYRLDNMLFGTDEGGYPLAVDPTTAAGPVVEKGEDNGVHDGRARETASSCGKSRSYI